MTFRKLRSIDVNTFKNDLVQDNCINTQSSSPDELLELYTRELTKLVDTHAPVRSKTITLRPQCPWFTEELHSAKHLKRKLERKWRGTKLTIDHQQYRNHCAVFNNMLNEARKTYYSDKIEDAGRDTKSLFKITNHLLDGKQSGTALPSGCPPKESAKNFSEFFTSKIENIRSEIELKRTENSSQIIDDIHTVSKLISFPPASREDVRKIT